MPHKQNPIQEFLDYYAQLNDGGKQVARDWLAAAGLDFKGEEAAKPKKPRVIQHCDECDYTKRHLVHKDETRADYHQFKPKQKSKRTASLAGAIGGRVRGGNDEEKCTAVLVSNGLVCNTPASYELHHDKGYVDYHPFVAPASRARSQSSANSVATSGTANSETAKENAGSVAGAASGGTSGD